jgi:hypothetical protein
MSTEEQRAADYRAEQIARTNATVARRVTDLAGSASARAALELAWAPVKYPDPGFDIVDLDKLPITRTGVN